MSAIWSSSENIFSLGVLPPVTQRRRYDDVRAWAAILEVEAVRVPRADRFYRLRYRGRQYRHYRGTENRDPSYLAMLIVSRPSPTSFYSGERAWRAAYPGVLKRLDWSRLKR